MRIPSISAILVMALTACGGSTGPTTAQLSGSLSFSYAGASSATTGNFSASGTAPSNNDTFGSSSWARASDSASDFLAIASVPGAASTWNFVILAASPATVGSSPISATSCGGSTPCGGFGFYIGATSTDLVTYTYACFLTSGTITIASINSTRATGSFGGTGLCSTQAGASSAVTVASGAFDVGVVRK